MQQPFRDRTEAGQVLANQLTHYQQHPALLVLGLPRGGVPVAHEIARVLTAPLDVLVVRKLGAPGHEELALGALASGGMRVLNNEVVQQLALDRDVIDAITREKQQEVVQREQRYRGDRLALPIAARTVILAGLTQNLYTGLTQAPS